MTIYHCNAPRNISQLIAFFFYLILHHSYIFSLVQSLIKNQRTDKKRQQHFLFLVAGNLAVRKEYLQISKLKKELPDVRLGGIWSPMECVPKAKVRLYGNIFT